MSGLTVTVDGVRHALVLRPAMPAGWDVTCTGCRRFAWTTGDRADAAQLAGTLHGPVPPAVSDLVEPESGR